MPYGSGHEARPTARVGVRLAHATRVSLISFAYLSAGTIRDGSFVNKAVVIGLKIHLTQGSTLCVTENIHFSFAYLDAS
jgi:hypothetical protein